jgi:hypothetical protein
VSKFKEGDSVTIIVYGHAIMLNKKSPEWDIFKESKEFPIITQTDNIAFIETCPELVGKTGIISSIKVNQDGQPKYALRGIPGKIAWYNEDQLQLNTSKL